MKLNDILTEAVMQTRYVTNADKKILDGLGTNDMEDLKVMFDNSVNPYDDGSPGSYFKNTDKLLDTLRQIGINIPVDEKTDNYLDEIWEEVEYQLEMRMDQEADEYYQDDLRDYDEEDRQAAWDDRYQAFKNEY